MFLLNALNTHFIWPFSVSIWFKQSKCVFNTDSNGDQKKTKNVLKQQKNDAKKHVFTSLQVGVKLISPTPSCCTTTSAITIYDVKKQNETIWMWRLFHTQVALTQHTSVTDTIKQKHDNTATVYTISCTVTLSKISSYDQWTSSLRTIKHEINANCENNKTISTKYKTSNNLLDNLSRSEIEVCLHYLQ